MVEKKGCFTGLILSSVLSCFFISRFVLVLGGYGGIGWKGFLKPSYLFLGESEA